MEDKLKEECGIFATQGGSSQECFVGLHALQHRGQEAAGIASYDTNKNKLYKYGATGEVLNVFKGLELKEILPGRSSIGHVRYSTSGCKNTQNYQPLIGKFQNVNIAIAHNGNILEANDLREILLKNGANFETDMDTEIILKMIENSSEATVIDAIRMVFNKIKGAFSIVILADNMIIGIRDQYGIRPLVLGKKENSYFLASESCALSAIGASIERDINPGEMILIKNGNFTAFNFLPKKNNRFCVFEYIYFLRPDSIQNNKSVYEVRKNMGKLLAKIAPVEADAVVAVPDSGIPAALGYAEVTKIKYECGIVRSHYIGRTFIQSTDSARINSVSLKHNANATVVKDKRIVLVDDSIVRGNTSRSIIDMLRQAGAREIHMRISSPEIKFSCLYGIDTYEHEKLVSNKKNIEELRQYLGLDSLAFLPIDNLYEAINGEKRNNITPQFCDACFTGEYFV